MITENNSEIFYRFTKFFIDFIFFANGKETMYGDLWVVSKSKLVVSFNNSAMSPFL
jgi:hypothetical protein